AAHELRLGDLEQDHQTGSAQQVPVPLVPDSPSTKADHRIPAPRKISTDGVLELSERKPPILLHEHVKRMAQTPVHFFVEVKKWHAEALRQQPPKGGLSRSDHPGQVDVHGSSPWARCRMILHVPPVLYGQ